MLNNRQLDRPVFAQPEPTPSPSSFKVTHGSDAQAYTQLKKLKLQPVPFPAPRGGVEPVLTLLDVLGGDQKAIRDITTSKKIVFHAGGDIGSTRGPATESKVTDKMLGDFHEANSADVPKFNFLLGDIVYSFGEAQYYYDQFYEPYRDYPAPIMSIAGNHDGMTAPGTNASSLDAFLRNFCATSFVITPEAGGLPRTAQIQPGVFFTFDAPFVKIISLYSNALEGPGVISDPHIGSAQIQYVTAAMTRAKKEKFSGAVLVAVHHPPFTAGAKHGSSQTMSSQLDKIFNQVGIWPHAVLSGHAHVYERITRTRNNGTQEIPYIVCGTSGHNVQPLQKGTAIRTPYVIPQVAKAGEQVVLNNYDDKDYGYLRIIVDENQLRIEYHPASDGTDTKTPDDAVTVDLKTRKLAHYAPGTRVR